MVLIRENIADKTLAEWLGISPQRLSQKFRDNIWDSIRELEILAEKTGYSFEWLRIGKGPEKLEQEVLRAAEPPAVYGSDGLNELTRLRMKVEKLTGENDAFREVIKIVTGRSPEERKEDEPLHDGPA